MKTTFAILLASTALTLGFAIPAWSVMHDGPRPQASRYATEDASRAGAHLLIASDDDDSDDDEGRRMSRGGDDDDDEDSDDDGDEEDDGSTGAAAPAPAGTVVPPNNGLFGSGAAPKVKVN
ncbi:hypothetical protein FHS85_001492 [Rhodoligotrophos appendicifer]|uniref:hypothetical protein n=1 Tax=Rhodoligotrophos appendicifer TaxID=987056 RepID=UPI00118611A4|nr:hypothetical protein [Rhodoligotrophos appendicifer]